MWSKSGEKYAKMHYLYAETVQTCSKHMDTFRVFLQLFWSLKLQYNLKYEPVAYTAGMFRLRLTNYQLVASQEVIRLAFWIQIRPFSLFITDLKKVITNKKTKLDD